MNDPITCLALQSLFRIYLWYKMAFTGFFIALKYYIFLQLFILKICEISSAGTQRSVWYIYKCE